MTVPPTPALITMTGKDFVLAGCKHCQGQGPLKDEILAQATLLLQRTQERDDYRGDVAQLHQQLLHADHAVAHLAAERDAEMKLHSAALHQLAAVARVGAPPRRA